MTIKMTRRIALSAIALLGTIFVLGTVGYTQTVIYRARIGGYAEDIDHIESGQLKNRIAFLEGFEIYTVPISKNNQGVFTRLCGFKIPEFDGQPTGFAYVESEGLFVMNYRFDPTKLFLFDQTCAFRGMRTIQYLNSSYRPGHMEGLAYIPANSPTFPDHLLMVVWDNINIGPARIEVVRRDGVVVSEIANPAWPASFDTGLGDVAFLSPNRLVVAEFNESSLYTMDFSGAILTGPVAPGGNSVGEGVVQLGDGRVAATNFPQSLLFFDSNLTRRPADDRNDVIGLNVNTPSGIAWNSATNQFLITHDSPSASTMPRVSAVPVTLDSATPVVDLSPYPTSRKTAYLPAENLIAVLRTAAQNDRAILLFNANGTLNSQISLSPTSLGTNFGQPTSLAFLQSANQFIVGFNGFGTPIDVSAERRRLRVLSRTGTLLAQLDLTATGTGGISGLDYFESPPGTGRLRILGSAGRLITTDLNGDSRNSNGALFGEFNGRAKLGLVANTDIATISSGPLAGAFAVIDGTAGEIVIFR